MEIFKQNKKGLRKSLSRLAMFYCFLFSLSAAAEQYRLDVLAELPTLDSTNIVAFIPVPSATTQSAQYFIANENSDLFLLDGTSLSTLTNLQLSKEDPQILEKLTAFTLHPNFSLPDQPGYQTLYTAHIETAKINNNIARVTELIDPMPLPFDAVITQWQLTINKTESPKHREVIRIAVPSATHIIQKIAFNPYSKNWHDDYGLLHIALSDNAKNQTTLPHAPLYSGVILRINPAKFGLRSYLVPNNNPFLKTHDVNNEIFILGSQKIISFHWSKQSFAKLFVQHIYDNKHLLAKASKGADWRINHQEKHVSFLTLSKTSTSKVLPYNGRNLKDLWGNTLYLSQSSNGWQLTRLSPPTEHRLEGENEQQNQAVWLFEHNEISIENKVKLLADQQGEPLLFDLTNKQLLTFTAVEILPQVAEDNIDDEDLEERAKDDSSDAYRTLLLILFAMVMAIILYRLRPINKVTKAQLNKQFARFDMDDSKIMLSFYKRHQSKVDSRLAVADIVESEILLNNVSLNTINGNNDNGYNLQQESRLRASFVSEHRNKLIDDQIRQVHLSLTDASGKVHIVCMYLRKGNQRFTKAKFFDILENILDWSWFIAKQLNPQATEKRKIKVLSTSPSAKVVSQAQHNNHITSQEQKLEAKLKRERAAKAEINNELHNIAVHDSELINSLDKLANLKQKGFLSDEEFSLAKAKILVDITRNK